MGELVFLPLKWTKDRYPDTQVGLYGRQPFARDYWGIYDKTSDEIIATHLTDLQLWGHIEPYIDINIVDIYVFYNRPDSVYYMAANVEQNYLRASALSQKPIYVYEWLRFHDSNRREGNRELEPYLVEAMAIIPYFSGAQGIVLWGHEPQLRPGDGQPYERLPLFMRSLKRVALLSEKIGRAQLVIDKPAHVLWKEERPLIRRLVVDEDECIVMAINPWQKPSEEMCTNVKCGAISFQIPVRGQHTTIGHIDGPELTLQ